MNMQQIGIAAAIVVSLLGMEPLWADHGGGEHFSFYIERLKAAEQGNVVAQRRFGGMYRKGRWVAKSYEKAQEWYSKAAEQGDADSQFWLGIAYQNGRGVEKDYEAAVGLYRKAAKGVMLARIGLGRSLKEQWRRWIWADELVPAAVD